MSRFVRPATAATASTSVFQDCSPVQSGAYVAGAGVYLLTVAPASAAEGLAEVSGVSTAAASCNTNYNADGVQFRLIQIDQTMELTPAQLADANHLQNLVAYQCLGVSNWNSVWTDPLGSPVEQFGLMDTLRSSQTLTACEVPLAVIYWTADQGIVFLDMWCVRRPVVSAKSAAGRLGSARVKPARRRWVGDVPPVPAAGSRNGCFRRRRKFPYRNRRG